ncbi:hypothetical protein E2542_SST24650 [Spatholobus suberectus]|nr:hypothetical protein E2542_SST24650 [Spatholobus suberectus]
MLSQRLGLFYNGLEPILDNSSDVRMVVWSWSPTARQMAVTGGVFVVGVSCFCVGAYFSMVNVAPQQERVKAQREALRNYFKKRFGD